VIERAETAQLYANFAPELSTFLQVPRAACYGVDKGAAGQFIGMRAVVWASRERIKYTVRLAVDEK
jgi:hypothetical protein